MPCLLLSAVGGDDSRLPEASALRFLPSGHLSLLQVNAFLGAVAETRTLLQCRVQYSRHGGAHRSADRPMGSTLVLPRFDRRVTVVSGFRAHLDAAATVPFPLDSRLRDTSLPDDILCTIARAVAIRGDLDATRLRLIDAHRNIADSVRSISRTINDLMPSSVRRIAADVNTAWMAVIIDSVGWLHRELVERFVYGFPVVGDIPDSGVYRPISPVSVATHLIRYKQFNLTAHAWNSALTSRLWKRAYSGQEARAADLAVAQRTRKELSKGLLVGPYSSCKALHAAFCSMFPRLSCREMKPRPMNRFGVPQKGSIRAIDDGRSNGANLATRLVETITTPHFIFVGVAARAIATAARARGISVPGVSTALLDLASAYRLVPTSQPWMTSIGFYNPISERPEFYWLPGHNFGLVSAVINFNLLPEFAVVAMRALFLVVVDHYVDDFIVVDVSPGGSSARAGVESFFLMLGSGVPRPPSHRMRSPELDPEKTKATNATNVVLGVVADTSPMGGSSPHVAFRVDPDRVDTVLGEFRAAFQRGVLTPHEASRLRGKLFFCLSAAYAMVGRAATLPLVQRQYRDSSYEFLPDSELHHSLQFFEALLPALPPLIVPVDRDPTPPLVIYTDASFYRAKRKRYECAVAFSRLRGGLGAVVFDPVSHTAVSAAGDPDWGVLLSSWRHDRRTYIAELETLAAISVYTTYPDLIKGRKVLHFIDNTQALSALVHGYSGKPDLAKSVNVFYLQMLALRGSVFFEYVPSKANIADLPSRRLYAQLQHELNGLQATDAVPDPLVVPSVGIWALPLSRWARPRASARSVPIPV